jgi:hypothetical protein
MMYKTDTGSMSETPRDRLETIDRRIARMKSLNHSQGDMLALRLIEHAETERRQILAQLSAAERSQA